MTKNKKILILVGAVISAVLIVSVCLFSLKKQKKEYFKVVFDSDGGNVISEKVVEKGMSISKPQDPTKEGYIFIEWLLNGTSYDFNSEVNENIKLEASWKEKIPEKELVTVKFDSDGGTTIANAVIEKGNKVEKPTDPTKEGYTFIEWQLSDLKYDFEFEVTEDLELVAKWEKIEIPEENNQTAPEAKKYIVKFNSNGGTGVTSQTVEEGKKAKIPTNPTKNGYTFAGWTLNGNNYDFNTVIRGNITLVAKWIENAKPKYTVTFNSNGGSGVASQTIEDGGKATQPGNPTRNGYTFAGWTLNGNNYDFNSVVRSNITLVAKWNENPKQNYTVTFNSNGGSSVANQTIQEGSKAVQPANPTREGYTFAGWTLNGNNYDFNAAVTGNITLVARWNEIEKTYTIKASPKDSFSPDMILSVYENENKISVSAIKYTDGVLLCSGSNTTVSKSDIAGESSFLVVLTNGKTVKATLV